MQHFCISQVCLILPFVCNKATGDIVHLLYFFYSNWTEFWLYSGFWMLSAFWVGFIMIIIISLPLMQSRNLQILSDVILKLDAVFIGLKHNHATICSSSEIVSANSLANNKCYPIDSFPQDFEQVRTWIIPYLTEIGRLSFKVAYWIFSLFSLFFPSVALVWL